VVQAVADHVDLEWGEQDMESGKHFCVQTQAGTGFSGIENLRD